MASWVQDLWPRISAPRIALPALWLLALAMSAPTPTHGQSDLPPKSGGASVEDRLNRLEKQYSAVVDENRRLATEVHRLQDRNRRSIAPGGAVRPVRGASSAIISGVSGAQSEPPNESTADSIPQPEWPAGESLPEWMQDAPSELEGNVGRSQFTTGYDDGYVLVPVDPESTPFSLRFNNQNQFRYTAFGRDVKSWTDSAGVVRDVTNRSNFEIPRGRAIVSGDILLPGLSYLLNIDYNTVTTRPIGFRAYWLSYRFSRAATIFVGQDKVPGSREWLVSSRFVLGPDRSLATTFFRPSLSQGIWFTGEPVDGLHYEAMVSNGFNTLNTQPSQLDSRLCWSGSLWWEPWGDFGSTYSDLEWHDNPVIRCGTSLTYSPEQGQQGNPDAPENAEIRLSDGTVITQTGAFAPGVTLQTYKIGLAAFDFAIKHRGLSLSAEFYLQDLFDLRGNGPLPLNSTFAYGGVAQVGYFLLRQQCEVYARTSQVSGAYGTGGEYAGGFNWYFLPGQANLRFTLDAAWINHSPADQNRTDYRAGDTGILLRTQIQTFF